MRGDLRITSGWILRLLAGFLMQQILAVSAIYNMEQTCEQMSTCFIADPSNCQKYGYCENGTLVGTGSCPSGYIYNARKGICDLESSNSCAVVSGANACKFAADNSFVADSTDCNRYYYCNNRVAEIRTCPANQIYDSKQTRCIYGNQMSSQCLANSICRLAADGTFPGDPANCGQFITCVNGVGTPGKCPDNTYFNKKRGGCQQDNPCQAQAPAGIGPGVQAPLPNNPEACKAAKGETFPQFLPDPQTCFSYYICQNKTGPGIWSKCPPGLHFNDGKCVTPLSFPCTKDRCGNINQEFVSAINHDCKNFLICKNETSQGAASGYIDYEGLPCANGKYFNEFTQMCEDKSPATPNYNMCPHTRI